MNQIAIESTLISFLIVALFSLLLGLLTDDLMSVGYAQGIFFCILMIAIFHKMETKSNAA